MIIAKLSGGLGNQMFQYATGRQLSLKNNTELKLDMSFFSNYKKYKFEQRDFGLADFNINAIPATDKEVYKLTRRFRIRQLDSLVNLFFIRKQSFLYDTVHFYQDRFYNSPDNVYIEGHFHNYRYFESIREVLIKEFSLKGADVALPHVDATATTVSVHIRRGDFINNSYHPVCGTDYYISAIDLLSAKLDNLVFFVFSDDIEWAKENFSALQGNFIYMNADATPANDLIRMSKCGHNIIANSSFSWWAAWLNTNAGKIVVAPKTWVNNPMWGSYNLIPSGWIPL